MKYLILIWTLIGLSACAKDGLSGDQNKISETTVAPLYGSYFSDDGLILIESDRIIYSGTHSYYPKKECDAYKQDMSSRGFPNSVCPYSNIQYTCSWSASVDSYLKSGNYFLADVNSNDQAYDCPKSNGPQDIKFQRSKENCIQVSLMTGEFNKEFCTK